MSGNEMVILHSSSLFPLSHMAITCLSLILVPSNERQTGKSKGKEKEEKP